MGIVRGTAKVLKRFVNFPKWMGATHLAGYAKAYSAMLGELITPKQAKHQETFEAALYRLRITEADLEERRQQLVWLFWLFSLITLGILGYSAYLWSQLYVRGGLVSLVVAIFAATLAFKQHFWLYQIKQRRLGCSWQEWLNYGLLGRKP